ncbi:MAG: hypothetical protein WCT21_02785 [Patescibacteria group bacterium]
MKPLELRRWSRETQEKRGITLTIEKAQETGIFSHLHDSVLGYGGTIDGERFEISPDDARALERANVSTVAELLGCTPQKLGEITELQTETKKQILHYWKILGLTPGMTLGKKLLVALQEPVLKTDTDATLTKTSQVELSHRLRNLDPEVAVAQKWRAFNDVKRAKPSFIEGGLPESKNETAVEIDSEIPEGRIGIWQATRIIKSLSKIDKTRFWNLINKRFPHWVEPDKHLQETLKRITEIMEHFSENNYISNEDLAKLNLPKKEWNEMKKVFRSFLTDIETSPEIVRILRKKIPTGDEPLPHWQMALGTKRVPKAPTLEDLDNSRRGRPVKFYGTTVYNDDERL